MLAIIYPTVVTICSVAISLSEEKIHGISRLSFNRLRVGFHLHFLEAVIVMVALGLGYFISDLFELGVTFYVLCAISVGYSLFFAIPEILLLVKSPGFVHRVLRRYWLFEIKHGCNRGPDQETEDFHTVMTEVVLTEGLLTAYRLVTRPSLLQEIDKKILPNKWVAKIGLSENQRLLIAQTLLEWQNDFLENVLSSGKRGLNKKGIVLGQIRYEDLVGQVYGNAIDVILERIGGKEAFEELLPQISHSISLIQKIAGVYEREGEKNLAESAFFNKLLASIRKKQAGVGNGGNTRTECGDFRSGLVFISYHVFREYLANPESSFFLSSVFENEPSLLGDSPDNPLIAFLEILKASDEDSKWRLSKPVKELLSADNEHSKQTIESAFCLFRRILSLLSSTGVLNPDESGFIELSKASSKGIPSPFYGVLVLEIYKRCQTIAKERGRRIRFKNFSENPLEVGKSKVGNQTFEPVGDQLFYSALRFLDADVICDIFSKEGGKPDPILEEIAESVSFSLSNYFTTPLAKEDGIVVLELFPLALLQMSINDVANELRENGACIQGRYSYCLTGVYEEDGWYDRVYLADSFMAKVDKLVFGWKIFLVEPDKKREGRENIDGCV